MENPATETHADRGNFIWDFIDEDLASGRYDHVRTRYPPEPNGHLHIGHCKAIYIDAMTARRYGGKFNLRFDDTNPAKEEQEFVDGIMEDIRWYGFDWDDGPYFASDYYEQCYGLAEKLILQGDAYVDELTQEQMRDYRGTLTQPGRDSPFRERPADESLALFRRMRSGEFPEGSYTLRARIDMSSPNVNLRDPVLYRILYKEHHRAGKAWCIYPMYDYAHPIGDALEGITHSLCSMEYEIHRPLYDWVVGKCGFENPPRQIEFARLNVTRTVMSKRFLRRLVEAGKTRGWDDPRMPTIAGMRRRGYPQSALVDFIERAGVSKVDSTVDASLLEHCVREALEETAPRAMAALRPLKVILTNWPEGKSDAVTLENHPNHPEMGSRTLTFGRELYIERDDFMENPPKKYFRLYPGGEVRLKGAYIVRCDRAVKDEAGEVVALECTVDMESRSGSPGSARKVKGTLHWVSGADAVPLSVRLYGPLLVDEPTVEADSETSDEDPEAEAKTAKPVKTDFENRINPDSLAELSGCLGEPTLARARVGDRFQFMRQGYFAVDPDSGDGAIVFNRTVGLKDSWAKRIQG
ncbi:MAG: glutamine--tRNA ligase/YqeY domain fusion protein [Oscillospiraceae bacterium]|jgi:glutaminyl-tRNA synthetase|nr:glutamine--tRNA ligase/YqeY domain fusion protein [Oscillospiraceae bacterium]